MFSRVFACSVALGLVSLSAQADEIFSCEDGGLVYVTSDNRQEMYDHPCVKAWFETNRRRQVAARASSLVASAGVEALFGRKLPSRSVVWLIYAGRDRKLHPTPRPLVRSAAISRHATIGTIPPRRATPSQPARTRKIGFRRR